MLTSLSFIFLAGLALAAVCKRLKLPRIIGMLITGILLGSYVLNLLDLKKVGRPAVMMSCVPASFEILGFLLLAPVILGITRMDAAVMGAVLGAVSPAVVIPRMV